MTTLRLTLQTIEGKTVSVPDPSAQFIHLQFRRFSGCPICNTHLRSLAKHKRELTDAGIREVIFFHSSVAELRTYEADIPFDLVADPDKTYYRQFRVEASASALLHPAIIGAAIRGAKVVFRGEASRCWIPKAENGRLGLPADFLVDRVGRIVASKYGKHAYDQWEVGDLLRLARAASETRTDSKLRVAKLTPHAGVCSDLSRRSEPQSKLKSIDGASLSVWSTSIAVDTGNVPPIEIAATMNDSNR